VSGRPALEAVVFDAGGTLVRLDFEWMSGALRGLGHDVGPAALRRAEVAGRRAFEASLDAAARDAAGAPTLGARGDIRRYFAAMLEEAGVPAGLVDPALARLYEREQGRGLWTRPAEGARACMDELAALGLRLACISNSNGRAAEHLATCDVRRGLEFVVDSAVEGVEKPDPAIFRIALDRLGVPAARALYVGDLRLVDGRGAGGAGLHFVLLDPHGDYAAPGEAAIDGIARLPGWVAENFTPVAGSARAGH